MPAIRSETIAWAPPEWTCCGFPLGAEGRERIELETAIETLHALADTITDADSTALGPAMHVAHMLVARQGDDGLWPATINARTGESGSSERSSAPLALYRRLAELLNTSEFDRVIAQVPAVAQRAEPAGKQPAIGDPATQ